MLAKHLSVGKKGEDEACNYLKSRGFSIKERNYWKKWGEIDIVVEKGRKLHFVEVKTVSREKFSHETGERYRPEDNVHYEKRRRLARVIETYLLERRISEEVDWQIDVVCVYLDLEGKLLKIEEIEDIIL